MNTTRKMPQSRGNAGLSFHTAQEYEMARIRKSIIRGNEIIGMTAVDAVNGSNALVGTGLNKERQSARRTIEAACSTRTELFANSVLCTFLASRHLKPLYSSIAEEISSSGQLGRLLDIQTGLGLLPLEIKRRDSNAFIVGIDRSRGMISAARMTAHASGLDKSVHFFRGDIALPPYPGRYFDVATSVDIMHHSLDYERLFYAVGHVLKPEGEFWIYDYRDDITDEVWKTIIASLPTVYKRLFARGPRSFSMPAYRERELSGIAIDSGFDCTAIENRTFTLFGQPMPVFRIIKLRKRNKARY